MRLAEEIGKEKQAGSFVRLRNGKLLLKIRQGKRSGLKGPLFCCGSGV